MSFQVVFNLYPCAGNIYLPNAYVVQWDKSGQPAHIMQKAMPGQLAHYDIALTPALAGLFQTIERLNYKALEAKFKPSKAKSVTPLAQLLENKETKSLVEAYIYRELDDFLGEIVANGFLITLDAEKRTLVKDVLIVVAKDELVPHLHFKKTATGIEYRLQLGTEDEKWLIRDYDVIPLTDAAPAWLLVGYTLSRVPGINGKMVKPFQKKDVVEVPAKIVREYFQKIVVKNANRTQIEPEGFDLKIADQLLGCQLTLTEDIFRKTWILAPLFRYQGRDFEPWEKRQQFTWVKFPDEQTVEMHQVRRDTTAERGRMDFLKKTGLIEESRAFRFPSDDQGNVTLTECIGWLAMHQKALESAGFQVVAPEQNGQTIALLDGHISLHTEMQNDWFDVHGTLTVGRYNFPFKMLVPFIKSGDRHFPLPDKTVFLIPEEWLTKYADFARALQMGQDDILRLPKTMFPLLDGLGLGDAQGELEVFDPAAVEFDVPSALNATLRPYQLEGVKWLVWHQQQGFGACLADDMGLGKTLQTITVLLHAKEKKEQEAALALPAEPQEPVAAAPKTPVPTPKTLQKPTKAKPLALQLDLFAMPIDTDFSDYQPAAASVAQPVAVRPTNRFNALIVLPASLVFNWRAELEKFAPSLYVCTHVGPKRHKDARALGGHHIVLTTYHTARNDLQLLGSIEWDYIVLDESQQIKNNDSEISKVMRRFEARNKLSLSGTPIENSLADLWTQMEFINPHTLGSLGDFKKHFIVPIERHNDPAAKESLFKRVRPFFLRRTKEEVAPDLPELTEQVFYSEMTPEQLKLYEKTKSAVRNEILSLWEDPTQKLMVLQALMRLRQLANHPALLDSHFEGTSGKFDDVMAQWETIRRSGHKVLIFSSFAKNLQIFRNEFERQKLPFAWLTGEVASADRQREVERFQNDPTVQAFFITTKAGGTGLNLTAADYVFILDPWWNPAVEAQAVARAHRIGLKHPVTAIRFIARESIEEKIREMQIRKSKLGQAFFADGEQTPEMSREDLEAILA